MRRRKDEIRLSPKHGLNPSLEVCFICGKDTGAILLPGLIDAKDSEAPRRVATGGVCPHCEETMKEGVFLIEVDEDLTTDSRIPYRTGRIVAIREEAFARIFPEHPALKTRVCYIDSKVSEQVVIEWPEL